MKSLITFCTIINLFLVKNVIAETVIADWYCLDKNVGVEVIIFNKTSGDIKFSFLNEQIGLKKFRTKCQLKSDSTKELTFHCNKEQEFGDFGFGIIKNWNHSINMGFFYDNHGEFGNQRPNGVNEYNEFLECDEKVQVLI